MEEERPTRNRRVRVGQGLELETSRWKILLIVQVRRVRRRNRNAVVKQFTN